MDTKALRQKILDLAIRGKLVPQDPNDESASVLLERIRAEKQQMVKDGKLKEKNLKNDTIIFKGEDSLHYEKFPDGTVKCIEDEIPFDLPEGWEWTRIHNIVFFQGGYAYKSNKYIPLSNNLIIRIGNVKNNMLLQEVSPVFIDDIYAEETSIYKLQKNDILFTMTGTKGRRDYFYSCIVEEKDIKKKSLFLNQRVGCLRIYDDNLIYPCLLLSFIQSTFVLDSIFLTETGNVNQGNIGSTATLNLLIPIPPAEEQYRIIERISIINDLVDIIESDKADLQDAIQFCKAKILDLAIRGKLVPQDPNDEPASVLLERIRAEKEELIKQGRIKRDKKESVIFKGEDNSYYEKIGSEVQCIDEELPFELPEGWSWCRLINIAEITMGSSPSSANVCTNNKYTEFHQGKIFFTDKIIANSNQYTKEITKLADPNSILLCIRAPVGEVNITDREICIGRGLSAVTPLNNISVNLIFYWLQELKGNLISKAKGTTFIAVTADVVKNLLIPLPPYNEQCRVADLVVTFFKILNSIEKSLR